MATSTASDDGAAAKSGSATPGDAADGLKVASSTPAAVSRATKARSRPAAVTAPATTIRPCESSAMPEALSALAPASGSISRTPGCPPGGLKLESGAPNALSRETNSFATPPSRA